VLRLVLIGTSEPTRTCCGYALANKPHDTRAIQVWLEYRSITSTAVYTALAPNRFKDFWRI
jgi:site-specific recombinase XerD